MRKITIPIFLAAILLVAMFGLIQSVRGQDTSSSGDQQVLQHEQEGDNVREISAPAGVTAPQQPDIGFIDSPTAGCYQPDQAVDACYINWYYMSVSASPNYMIAMTATINSIGPVARYQGFFQTSMYVPYNMLGNGIKVACGAPGAGGNPNLGNAYAWTIRAIDSTNLKSANYGTVYCPPYVP